METAINNELISLILPVYNVEAYLKRSINSVLGQTYKNIEIILVDDGSTDGSGKICDSFVEMDSRIKVYHTENKGLSAARNYGFTVSHGNYIFYLDSDDYISEDCIELLYKRLVETGADFVQAGIVKESIRSRKLSDDKKALGRKPIMTGTEYMSAIFAGKTSVTVWGKLFKRYIIEKVSNPSGRLYEDCAVICKYANISKTIAMESEASYYYLVYRPDSITSTISAKAVEDWKWCVRRLLIDCKKLFPSIEDEALKWYRASIIALWSTMVRYTPTIKLMMPFLMKEEERYIVPNMKAIRNYVLKHFGFYMKMPLKRKLQTILLCYLPFIYVIYVKLRSRWRRLQ